MRQIAVAALVALVCAAYVLVSPYLFPTYHSDFDQLWEAARVWRAGQNPYDVVLETHQRRGLSFGLLYPFGAVVVAWPMSFLPIEWARAVVVSVAGFAFSFLLLGRAWWLFPVLLSAAMRSSVSLVQVAPLAAAAVLSPAFGWVAAYKPNVGVMAWVAQPTGRDARRFLIPPLALLLLSFLLWPSWLPHWLDALKTGEHLTPLILRPWGWLLVLAAFRWREPAARYLFVLALVPATPAVHDALPLLVLLATSFRSALVLALLSHVADLWGYALAVNTTGFSQYAAAQGTALLFLLYLPALGYLLLRRRPCATV